MSSDAITEIGQFPGGIPVASGGLGGPGKVEVTKGVKDLLQTCSTTSATSFSQTQWDDVGKWAKGVLGHNCEIAFENTNVEDGATEGLWHLTGADGAGGDVVVRVKVEKQLGEDGKLDYDKSAQAVQDKLIFTLKDVARDLGPEDEQLADIWAPAPLGNYAQCALQHAAHVPRGRFLIASGNALIDVEGGSSSAALEPVVRKLLEHTTLHTPPSLPVAKE